MAIYDRICRECGGSFRGGPRAWYCPDCRKQREKERAKKYRANGFERKIGSTDYCRHCGKPYTVNSGLQRYCPECGKINAKMVDRRQSLSYYRQNKAAINPARNKRRRIPERKCVVCGALFRPRSQQIVCSEECRKIRRRDLHRLIYGKIKAYKAKQKPAEE